MVSCRLQVVDDSSTLLTFDAERVLVADASIHEAADVVLSGTGVVEDDVQPLVHIVQGVGGGRTGGGPVRQDDEAARRQGNYRGRRRHEEYSCQETVAGSYTPVTSLVADPAPIHGRPAVT